MGRSLVAILAGLLLLSGEARAGGDAGRAAAIQWCSRCHVVGDDNPMGGIDSTPSFFIFARKPDIYPPERIRTFRERPPHPPQKVEITKREMEDLIAYVKGLKDD